MLAAVKTRFQAAAPRFVLRPYTRPRHPWAIRAKDWIGYAALILLGLTYGLFTAIFPVFMYTWLVAPLLMIVLVTIWALPHASRYPAKAMEFCFWCFLVALLLWPNYLAIAIPGLPWITVQRLFLAPLALMFLISLSIAPAFRAEMRGALQSSVVTTRLMVTFVLIQVVTTFFTSSLFDTSSRLLSNQLTWTMMFFISIWLFQKPDRDRRFHWSLIAIVSILAVIGIAEHFNRQILWANHIPSFLRVADESVERTLAGKMRAGTEVYRVQAIFATSLNFAQLMGLATAFVLHGIYVARSFIIKLILALYLPVHLIVIVWTDSRLGSIAFFGSILGYIFLLSLRRWLTSKESIVAPFALLMFPVGVAAFVTASLTWNRLKVMTWGGGQHAASTEGREMQWAALWPKLAQWPLGYGPGNGAEALGYTNGEGVLSVDSYYITLMLDYGIVEFIVYLTLMLLAALSAGRTYVTDQRLDPSSLLAPACIVVVNYIIVKAVLSQENEHALIFIILGLIVALLKNARIHQQSIQT